MDLKTVTKKEYESIVANSLYEEKSREIIKLIIFECRDIHLVAKKKKVSPSYVRVIMRRFEEKIKRQRLEQFMLKQEPQQQYKLLSNYHQEIKTLTENGYASEQVFQMISETDSKFTLEDVQQYIKQEEL